MPDNPPQPLVSDAPPLATVRAPASPTLQDQIGTGSAPTAFEHDGTRIPDGFASIGFGTSSAGPTASGAPNMPAVPDPAAVPHLASTPWDMFLAADVVVQAVMALLVFASVLTWTILLAKGVEITLARRRLGASLRLARTDEGLAALARSPSARVARALLTAAEDEVLRSDGLPVEGVKDRIALRLRRIEHGVVRRMGRGTGLLASIGSCAPFVGLFGTVWGIMNSFIGISRSKTTSLAVVAPGIAEALLATAFGLAAAIPAVLTYNAFARALAGYRAELSDLSALVLAHAARELDRAHLRNQTPAPSAVAHPIRLRPAAE